MLEASACYRLNGDNLTLVKSFEFSKNRMFGSWEHSDCFRIFPGYHRKAHINIDITCYIYIQVLKLREAGLAGLIHTGA